jgi:hypothetical protein
MSRSGKRAAVRLAALLTTTGTLHFATPKPFDRIIPTSLPGTARFWTYVRGGRAGARRSARHAADPAGGRRARGGKSASPDFRVGHVPADGANVRLIVAGAVTVP